MKKLFLFSFFSFLFSLSLSALDFDFGLLTNQYFGVGNNTAEEETLFEYQGDVIPHALFYFGDKGNKGKLIITAGLSFGYEEKNPYFVFEVFETAYSVNFGVFGLNAGRMFYSDPLFIAEGLFDGFQASYASPIGSFSLGAWYTGLLYKKTANIFMTNNDANIYAREREPGNLTYSYFAPRRLFTSLDWKHLSLWDILRLGAAISAQFDLNNTGSDEVKLHSQYFTLKAGVIFKDFLFELGGSIETLQTPDVSVAFAWETGVYWNVPANFRSRLSFTVHSAGGAANETVSAFVPITAKYYGEIFQPVMSGVTALCLDYTARIIKPLGASVNMSYFVRNDLFSYQNINLDSEKKGYAMGLEFFTRLFWIPVTDVQLSLGAGVFAPSAGNAWKSDAKNLWRVDLTAILALF